MARAEVAADGEVKMGPAVGGDGDGEPSGPSEGDANCADKSAAEVDVDVAWLALPGRVAEEAACISGGVDGGEKN